jgi:hypothetical protein
MAERIGFIDYGGVAQEYSKRHELYRTVLDETCSYSSQVFGNSTIAEMITLFREEVVCRRIVLAGWIDQVVPDVQLVSETSAVTEEFSLKLDNYRPDQGGDIGVFFCGDDDEELLEIGLSRDYELITVTRYLRS